MCVFCYHGVNVYSLLKYNHIWYECVSNWKENKIQLSIFEKREIKICTKDRQSKNAQKTVFNFGSERVQSCQKHYLPFFPHQILDLDLAPGDTVHIYDGSSSSSRQLASLTTTMVTAVTLTQAGEDRVITSTGNRMYVKLTSHGHSTHRGFLFAYQSGKMRLCYSLHFFHPEPLGHREPTSLCPRWPRGLDVIFLDINFQVWPVSKGRHVTQGSIIVFWNMHMANKLRMCYSLSIQQCSIIKLLCGCNACASVRLSTSDHNIS